MRNEGDTQSSSFTRRDWSKLCHSLFTLSTWKGEKKVYVIYISIIVISYYLKLYASAIN